MSDGGMIHLQGLNTQQREAVETVLGPLLIVAGAGTGKTRTLTSRIAHIIKLGLVDPSQILAVAFTNKAANELLDRVSMMTRIDRTSLPWVGTFHSLSARILRRESEYSGLGSNFTIYNDSDKLSILKNIFKDADIDERLGSPSSLATLISRWKDDAKLPENLGKKDCQQIGGCAQELYEQYQEVLRISNGADFGDLILHVVNMLSHNDHLLDKYQDIFRFTLVDEYQDVNIAQYKWLRLLTQKRSNICCVGDDDQAIYSWRGARPDIMLGFADHFADAKIIRMEQNYRSTEHILGAAADIISNNVYRHRKKLRCANKTGNAPAHKVEVARYTTNIDEADGVVSRIGKLAGRGGKYRFEDIAVSARTWSCLAEVEQSLVKSGIPYRVVGGPRFYERKEIRDALAYLKLCNNRADAEAFMRSVNTPARGVGAVTVRKVRKAAVESEATMFDTAGELIRTGTLSGKPASGLSGFMQDIESWGRMFARCDSHDNNDDDPPRKVGEIVLKLIHDCGMHDYYIKQETEDADFRLDNLKKLVEFAGRHQSLDEFLEHVGLMSEELSNVDTTDRGQVTIMTLHAAKGSEYPVMFLIAWEEGILPWKRDAASGQPTNVDRYREKVDWLAGVVLSMRKDGYKPGVDQLNYQVCKILDEHEHELREHLPEGLELVQLVYEWEHLPDASHLELAAGIAARLTANESIEEERRLAHVGITRAMERCIISNASMRKMFNTWMPGDPSRFLAEISREHLQTDISRRLYGNVTTGRNGQYSRDRKQVGRGKISPAVRTMHRKNKTSFSIGDRVSHRKFGHGTVHSVSTGKLMVRFDDNRAMMVLSDYLRPAKE